MDARLRAFWLVYPDRPDTHRKEAWAAYDSSGLVRTLNETYSCRHWLSNLEELTEGELVDPTLIDDEGTTVMGLMQEFDEPGQLFQLHEGTHRRSVQKLSEKVVGYVTGEEYFVEDISIIEAPTEIEGRLLSEIRTGNRSVDYLEVTQDGYARLLAAVRENWLAKSDRRPLKLFRSTFVSRNKQAHALTAHYSAGEAGDMAGIYLMEPLETLQVPESELDDVDNHTADRRTYREKLNDTDFPGIRDSFEDVY